GGRGVEKKEGTSAFREESASRRRPRAAAAPPATRAYTASPSVTMSAARPSSALAQDFAAWYFEGHFVIIDPGVVTKVPSARCVPVTPRSRPLRRRWGTDPL